MSNPTHIWWSVAVAFKMLCALGATFFFLWIAAVVISAIATVRRPRGDHRVGGVLKP